ncbi:sulfatase family protein [Rhodopirellula sallentina]|uniref:Mucin-desulfating sulfatase (N-acetylglucosamine-6-sulfatase) n=1 Tax=Rhodopirellula sallentina SM41 TaxID=1263870 RepID=M5U151_9BACT|nr:sulfatase [Rhodopirellula sallentina]EMI55170.1 mucin-desulfating sulfatase (N-acetylglucosamine-6-sulfatase) [Rhodopirellula sallentina SM41]
MKLLPIFLAIAMCLSAAADESRPNILFIMTDDHAAHALGAYGGRLANLELTPNLDRLAAQGIRFDNTFCNNSICTPSRASILTGQYPQTNGVLDLDIPLDLEKQYLPHEMRRLGYRTAVIGKWHLHSEPTAFDYYKVLPGQGKYFDPTFHEKGKGQWPNNIVASQGHSTDVITDLAIKYIKERDKTKPFFLMHHYKAPHDDFEFAPRYQGFLANTEIPEPSSLYYQPEWGSKGTRGANGSLEHYIGTSVSDRHDYRNYNEMLLDGKYEGKQSAHLGYQAYLKAYLRCVKGVDDNLGRLFEFLKSAGIWENTVIIYTGDQGMMLGEHDLQDKRWMYEESMRMPFLVHYPRMIQPKMVTDLLINNTDFAPTMIELAGGSTPEYMQGRSFLKTLQGKEESDWRTATYYRYWMHIIHHYVPAHFGIRTKQYKLVFYYGKHYLPESEFGKHYWANQYHGIEKETPHTWELYDLKEDPQELRNRYHDPKYQGVIAELKKELKRQRIELGETDANYPAIQAIVEKHWND